MFNRNKSAYLIRVPSNHRRVENARDYDSLFLSMQLSAPTIDAVLLRTVFVCPTEDAKYSFFSLRKDI